MVSLDRGGIGHKESIMTGFAGARIRFSTKGMPRPEWLEKRSLSDDGVNGYLGASQSASVLGIGNPNYSSSVRTWGSIVNGHDSFSSVPATIGTNLESAVLKIAGKMLGKKVFREESVLQHHELDFVCCNLDGYIKDSGVIIPVEAKCVTRDEMVTWATHPNLDWLALADAINGKGQWPSHTTVEGYWCQVQHQLAVCADAPYAYLVACVGAYPCLVASVVPDAHEHLVLDRDFFIIKIERDEAFIMMLLETLTNFWNRHVLTKKCPQENVRAVDLKAMRRHIRSNGKEVERDDLAELALEFVDMGEAIKAHRERLQEIEVQLRLKIDAAEKVKAGDVVITLKENKRGVRPIRARRLSDE